jgi:D-sedoheptulose 7-phosphate isomerase
MDIKEEAGRHFEGVVKALEKVDLGELNEAVGMLRKAKEDKAFVWIVGNGGSAATAEHFANDLLKMGGLKAIAIPGQTPTVTAYGNDEGWKNMFREPVMGLSGDDDILVAISCSGNSENVVELAEWWGNDFIVLTGDERIKNKLANINIDIPIIHADDPDITVQEDVHLAVCHAIAKALRV